MSKGVNFKPTKENREYLEALHKAFKGQDKFKGMSRIINAIITDNRLANTKNPFR